MIRLGPPQAGISSERIYRLADNCIRIQVWLIPEVSSLAGLPGGFDMIPTVPADTVKFYGQALVLAQKLAYLYGMGDLLSGEEADDLTYDKLFELLIVMMLGGTADIGVSTTSRRFSEQVLKHLPKRVPKRTWYYPFVKRDNEWVGTSVTMPYIGTVFPNAAPIASGVVSYHYPATIMRHMGKRLKKYLNENAFAENPAASTIPAESG